MQLMIYIVFQQFDSFQNGKQRIQFTEFIHFVTYENLLFIFKPWKIHLGN